MKKHIGNLLLVLGTILGSISGANSVRPWRTVDLSGGLETNEYLFQELELTDGTKAAAGALVTAELIQQLSAAEIDEVQVRVPPLSEETVSAADSADRVLAATLNLGTKPESISQGRRLNPALAQKLLSAGINTLTVNVGDQAVDVDLASCEGDLEALATTLEEQGAPAEQVDAASGKGLIREALEIEVPDEIVADRFLDAEKVERIQAAGITEVPVRITADFSWSDWSYKWPFIGALLLMIAGIALKRSGATPEALSRDGQEQNSSASPRELLVGLCEKTKQISAEVDNLSASEIHARVDPLISEECYLLVNNRAQLQRSLGTAKFAALFAPFSNAERKLNRTWSAAVDGHAPEARKSLAEAIPHLEEAVAAMP